MRKTRSTPGRYAAWPTNCAVRSIKICATKKALGEYELALALDPFLVSAVAAP